jgi:peroxiredoxin
LAQNHDLFRRFGIDIIALSTDDQENTQAMIDEVNPTFKIISDSTYTISQQWEVFNLLGDGVAAPSAFIIGKNNAILWAHRGSSSSDRPPTDFLLAKSLDLLKKIAN